ncbi:flagellar assembly protein FliH [Geomicrobium sp. JCM 19039]|uniref:flagellar assembly protein FliH n=1 Tax=Geomicrobium sp. JCM 19039 TaxID=1460636 RepID=UPI00045F387E|nr:flagellar assembly protein FliH [Geomicrobium sp. JCM 19039]GAK10921.1 flagellar assembly protein FliH [Geomicrobium sp. JCM 19039]
MSNLIKRNRQNKSSTNERPFSLVLQPIERETEPSSKESSNEQVEAMQDTGVNIVRAAQEKAATIIESAKQEAARLEASLVEEKKLHEAEAKRLFEEQREAGWQKGYEKGQQEGHDTYLQEIDRAEHVVQAAKEDYDRYVEQAEESILQLAMAFAKQIVGQEVSVPEGYDQFLKQAIEQVKDEEEVLIYIHPNHFADTVQRRGEYEALLTMAERVRFFADPSLEEDGCLIKTSYGHLDASVHTQLDGLHTELEQRLVREREHHESY